MTARFTKVAGAIWRSPRFRGLPDRGKLLMLYFITNEHQTSAGCYRLPEGYALTDLGWGAEDYNDALSALVADGLVVRDPPSETIYIDKWFRHSPPMNHKHALGIISVIKDIEPDALRERVNADLLEADGGRLLMKGDKPSVPYPPRPGARQ